MSKSHHALNEVRTFPQKRYAERRHWLDGIKIASGCIDCGVWGPPEILSFDHVCGEKKFNVGQSWNQGRALLELEIAKCEVVCMNCHAIRTKSRNEGAAGAPPFIEFQKIPRLTRECTITEKINGTNGAIWVDGDGDVWPASKSRWLTLEEDNFGFAKWVKEHEEEFRDLGTCVIRGEWWGKGIQSGYGLNERRFSLFNTSLWVDRHTFPDDMIGYPLSDEQQLAPACCHVVPVLYQGVFSTLEVERALNTLTLLGSDAAPGFMKPEGVVVYHHAAGQYFKKTCEHDDEPKNAHHLRAEGKLPRHPNSRPYDPNTTGRRKGCEGYTGIERRIPR